MATAPFPPDQVIRFDVQNGDAQRSLVRKLDLVFSRPDDVAAMVASLNDGTVSDKDQQKENSLFPNPCP